jgi:mono/diheme cytochrome c family protein
MPKIKNLLRIPLSTIALFVPVLFTLTLQAADPASSKSAAIHAGQDVFTAKCGQCHTTQADQVRLGPSLYHEMKKKSDAQVRAILKNGKGKMPSFDGKLTPQETSNLLAYLHTL